MKENLKINFCFICCVLSFLVSLLSFITTGNDVRDIKEENSYLMMKLEKQSKELGTQEGIIEGYKQYVDDIARCIVEGEW